LDLIQAGTAASAKFMGRTNDKVKFFLADILRRIGALVEKNICIK
jgi:hypothetical protein